MHRYFGTKALGWEWPDAPSASNTTSPPAPPAPPLDHGWSTMMAPWMVLAALATSIVCQWASGREIGNVACAWRTSYSPSGAVFAIWSVIYVWTIVSVFMQAIICPMWTAQDCTAEEWNSYLLAWSWALCGLWIVVFGNPSVGSGGERRTGIVLAAFVLVSAAVAALGAVCGEAAWRSHRPGFIAHTAVPSSLFAGWLCVAATLNVGVAWRAVRVPPDPQCLRDRGMYTTRVAADPIDRHSAASWVPLGISVVISIAAILVPDPILPVPPFVAILFMKGHLKNWLALELLAVTCAASVVAVVFRAWVVL